MTEITENTIDTIVVESSAQDSVVDENAQTDVINVGEITIIDKTMFVWLEYTAQDWVETTSYYKLVIPYSAHKCLNACVSTMLIESGADAGDVQDENGYENNIATWKLLANDTIVIKSDEPLDCKILIEGER